MPLSNAERQRRHRAKVKGKTARLDLVLPYEIAVKLHYLARHWQCSKTEALSRMLMDTWDREGNPVPGYDAEGNQLPGNNPTTAGTGSAKGEGRTALPPDNVDCKNT